MIKSSFARHATATLASVVATALCLSAAIGPGATAPAAPMAVRVLA